MRRRLLEILFFHISLLSAQMLVAQDSSKPKQIWPEVDVYYRFNERFRLYGMVSGTRSNSSYTDGTVGIYMDYFALPWLRDQILTSMHDTTRGYYWWFRIGYSYSDSPPEDAPKVVNIIETESNNTFQLPAKITLDTRNRFDWRFVNGDFQPIYRPRAKFLRNFKTDYLTFDFYIWSEYFFYLNDNSEDKLRLTFGSEIKALRNMDFEVYYLIQFPHSPKVSTLYAIGLQIDLYLRSKKYGQRMDNREK